ncbi:hypothetical protein, partial [Staphylococcus hominis]|uniref:hypothetical protein n=1 Tax=Staphylococcus hominis TaxID=1290 RepID=UPI0016439648
PYLHANRKEHDYPPLHAQYYPIWIQHYKTQNPNTATMLPTPAAFLPPSYLNSLTRNNIAHFPLIPTNIQRTPIFMPLQPHAEYITPPKSHSIH